MGPLYTLLEVKLHKLSGVGHVLSFCADELKVEGPNRAEVIERLKNEALHLSDQICEIRKGVGLFAQWNKTKAVKDLVELVRWLTSASYERPCDIQVEAGVADLSFGQEDLGLEALLGLVYHQIQGRVTGGIRVASLEGKKIRFLVALTDELQLEFDNKDMALITPLQMIFIEGAIFLDSLYRGNIEKLGIQCIMHPANTLELILLKK